MFKIFILMFIVQLTIFTIVDRYYFGKLEKYLESIDLVVTQEFKDENVKITKHDIILCVIPLLPIYYVFKILSMDMSKVAIKLASEGYIYKI